jgi:uncharacterized protein (TIGR03067 family)
MRVVGPLILVVGLGVIPACQGGEGQKKSDLDGTWKSVATIKDGKDKDSSDHTLIFEGNTFTIKEADRIKSKGTFTRNQAKTPHEIDMTATKGRDEARGKTIKGIYEVTGETLKWCFREPDGQRPTEFAVPEGSGAVLVTLKRVKK